MNLAVLLYEDEDPGKVPEGMPLDWPSRADEIGESTTLPGEDWILMTQEEYDDYRADPDRKAVYDAWWEANRPQDPPPEE